MQVRRFELLHRCHGSQSVNPRPSNSRIRASQPPALAFLPRIAMLRP
jgi:hypothetical protein